MSLLDLTADEHKQRRETTNRQVLTPVDRFTARFKYLFVGLAVLCTETSLDVWDITPFPGTLDVSSGGDGVPVGQDLNAATNVFYGGQTYTVEGSLATALTSKGYNVT